MAKDWSVAESETELEARLRAYKADGYSLFPRLYSEPQMATWRDEQNRLEDASVGMLSPTPTHWFGNMLERSAHLMCEFASRTAGHPNSSNPS